MADEVSHKQIYDRLLAVEGKIDRVEQNTHEVVVAFQNAKGAFAVLDWLSRFAGKIMKIVGFFTLVGAAFYTIVEKWWK